jgi:hypothetical protein
VAVTFGGAAINPVGQTKGYQVNDTLNCTGACLTRIGGIGSGFSIKVATIGAYSFKPPPGVTLMYMDASSPGGGGGCGITAGGNAGGGGGGGGAAINNMPMSLFTGATIQITTPTGGAGCIFGGAAAQPGANLTITGTLTDFGPTLAGAPAGNSATAGVGGTGGIGGTFGNAGGAGGTSGNNGGVPTLRGPMWMPGCGGGGGGPTGAPGGSTGSATGACYNFYVGAAAGTGNASGGAGGGTFWGNSGTGGNGTTPSIGQAPTQGYGGGGGGGGPGFGGGKGGDSWVRLRW